MKTTPGRDLCIASRWTQKPNAGVGSGRYGDLSPLLIAFQDLPPSSVRKAPAAEMAMYMRLGLVGSSTIVCRPMPPAPGDHFGPVPCPRRPDISCHDVPP